MLKKLRDKVTVMPLEAKASVAYAVCSILQRCLSLITMPLFTRLLSTEEYGQNTVYQSWMAIFTIFITLNLCYGSFPTAMVKYKDDRYGYVSAIQNIALVLAGVFLALYLPMRDLWNGLINLPAPLVLLMMAEIVMQFFLQSWYSIRQFTYQYKSVIIVTLLVSLFAPVFAYILVINSTQKGYARIFGYSCAYLIAGLFCFIYSTIRGKGGMKKEYWKYAFWFNVPLIPYYLSQMIFNQSDRIMIDKICGTDKAGIYGIAYTLATLMVFALNSINNSYVPWFYSKIREGKSKDNQSVASGIAILMAFLLLAVIALAPEVVSIMAGSAYMEAIWAVPPVAMSILLLFYTQLFINVEFYYEERTKLVWGSIFAAVLNVVLNWLLIPVFGFVAASYTTLVSYFVFAYSNYLIAKRIAAKNEIAFDYFDLKALIIIFVVFGALAFLALFLYNYIWIRYGIIAAVLLGLVVMHKKVIRFVKTVLVRK